MENVKLRKLIKEDKNTIYEWISDSNLRKMTGTRGIPTVQGHEKWFKNKILDLDNEILIIEYEEKSVGIIGTNSIDLINKNAEMYLYIGDKQAKGKGIATKAVKSFIYYLSEKYEVHKINARIFSFNNPSIGLFEKCGFVLEGRLKEQIYLRDDNTYADLLWYSLILDEIK